MASQLERTFGARLANAAQISTHLKSFTAYAAPTPNTSIVNYDALLASLTEQNKDVATKKATYSAAVEARQSIFFKDKNSVLKLLSPISATVRATIGKTAKPTTDIAALVEKIRGIKKEKPKDETANDATNPKKETVSQSERSYGSIMQNFSNIISTLANLGSTYAPVNVAHQLPALNTTLSNLSVVNNAVTTNFGALKSSINTRAEQYNILTEITQRIKEAIKSQYGTSSTEFILVKGLKV